MSAKKFLEVSTRHVTEAESKILTENASHSSEYGWLTWVGIKVAFKLIPNPSAGLLSVVNMARDSDCEYIMFDRDIDPIPGIQTYDW